MCQEAVAEAHGMDLVGVTLLTSLGDKDLPELGLANTVSGHVEKMARLAYRSGLAGVITSGAELPRLKEIWPEARLVVPGIRTKSSHLHDQARVITPRAALDAGATDLVIGRMLTEADNPEQTYADLQEIFMRYKTHGKDQRGEK
jgi:orotidine-5'-phosphate decarboxylase